MPTVIAPGEVPEVGVRVIQLADALADHGTLDGLARLICRLDDPPAASEKARLDGETVIAGVEAPCANTSRIRLFWASAKKTFPELSTATPRGLFRDAETAGPPSPEKPAAPLPASVVTMPPADTFRIRLLQVSPMKMFPDASMAIAEGVHNDAEVAGPPSPEKPAIQLPATVAIAPSEVTFRIRLFPVSAIKRSPAAFTATPLGNNDADVAGPLSPGPLVPPPATVVMMPLADTFRIRRLLVSAI